MSSTWTKRDTAFTVMAMLLVLSYTLLAGGNFPLDDSWIHQTFGRNLAQYGEWAFIPGTPSAASTSPLYTVLLSVGYALRIPFRLWTHGLGAAALAGAAVIGSRLALIVTDGNSRAAWLTGLALLLTWQLLWAAGSGMETLLFGTLALLLIRLAWREVDPQTSHETAYLLRRGAIYGVLTALTALARPEGVLLGGIVAGLLLIVRPQGSLRRVLLWGTAAAVGFALCIAPYLWLNLNITGGVLPDTAAAKFEQHAVLLQQPYPLRYGALLGRILLGGQALLVPGMLMYIWRIVQHDTPGRAVFYLLPMWWALALITLYAARLPATYQHGRYVLPALPALLVMGTIGALWLWQKVKRKPLVRVPVQVLMLSAAVVTLVFTVQGAMIYARDVAIIDNEMVTTAQWIDENIPPDELLAIHDIGAVGYVTPRPLLDIAGLASPDVIPIVDDADALWSLMEERNAQYLMAFPDQIPGGNLDDPRLCEIFSTDTQVDANNPDEPDMAVYRLAWNRQCKVD